MHALQVNTSPPQLNAIMFIKCFMHSLVPMTYSAFSHLQYSVAWNEASECSLIPRPGNEATIE